MAAVTHVTVPVPENGRVSEIVWHVPVEEFDAYAAVYADGLPGARLPLAGGGECLHVRGMVDGARLSILGYVGATPIADIHVSERAA